METHTSLPFDSAILDEAIARTGVARYRFLCLDHPDPQVRAGYQRLVTEIAAGTYEGQRYDPIQQPQSGSCCDGQTYPPEEEQS